MQFTLPPLPYDFGALEPYVDAQTMEIHHDKHHQAYVNGLNEALVNQVDLQEKSLEDLLKSLDALPDSIATAVRNHGGGHYNHSLFWKIMAKNGGGQPQGPVGVAIAKQFGSFAAFQDQFNKLARTRFGSGWAWLSVASDGRLVVTSTANQDCPLSEGLLPIMGLDVWEHAYYLKYQNRRPDYIAAWWNVVNWEAVEENYHKLVG